MDRIWASLTVPLSMYSEKVRMAFEEYIDSSGGCIEAREELGLAWVENNETNCGEFPDLEERLIELEVPFDRYTSNEGIEFPEHRRVYRPACGGLSAVDMNIMLVDREPFILAWAIRECMHLDGDEFKLAVTSLLNEHCPDDYLKLEAYNNA